MKTYDWTETAVDGAPDEWVPADVARGLYTALEELADEYQYHVDHGKPWQRAKGALAAADGEDV